MAKGWSVWWTLFLLCVCELRGGSVGCVGSEWLLCFSGKKIGLVV